MLLLDESIQTTIVYSISASRPDSQRKLKSIGESVDDPYTSLLANDGIRTTPELMPAVYSIQTFTTSSLIHPVSPYTKDELRTYKSRDGYGTAQTVER